MIESHFELGRRIARAREEESLSQTQLAEAIAIDRTALSKVEAGTRKVSATELFSIAEALDRRIDWFVSESEPAVISRREDPSVSGQAPRLDSHVDLLARDVAFLVREGVLQERERSSFPMPDDLEGAERLARDARSAMGAGSGPLRDLQTATEGVDLLAFSLDLGTEGGDAAYVEVGGWGVALINGALDPGRRRFNLAHELGHHLVGDAYSPEVEIPSGGPTEALINAFAVHLLMPREDINEHWLEFAEDRRLGAVAIASRFRVSWSAACHQLVNLGLIEEIDRKSFEAAPPTAGDAIELGERWVEELVPPSIPTEYGQRVVKAYRTAKLTGARTIELLHGTVRENELPSPNSIPLDAFRREFETLR